ncbi:keratin, type I cytoskeletal 10-like [Diachasmimorpha longicaudata]|uniref:keratin, type I cytoskeletal 10-like n=1 Tax=Diachasmimorpha longicaudata TaxID=58733 RepID=UPI0030B86F66
MSRFCIILLAVASASARPIIYYLGGDNYGVELAAIREPVAAASVQVDMGKLPKNSAGKTEESGYHKEFGTDADGEKGFESGTYAHGQNGYKELDTFHKQVGDKYGFEEHSEFGYGKGKQSGGGHAQEKSDDAAEAGTSAESYYVDGSSSGSGEYLGGGEIYAADGDGGNYNEYSGGSGEGTYSESSSYSTGSQDGDKSGSGEYSY